MVMQVGFAPIAAGGADFRGSGYNHTIDPAYSTVIGFQDAVTLVNNRVQRAAATSRIAGVFLGCEYVDPQGRKQFSRHWPGTANCTDIKAHVLDDPDALFQVLTTAGTNLAESMVGQVAPLTAGAAPASPMFNSTMTLAIGSVAAAPGTNQGFVIVRLGKDALVGAESQPVIVKAIRHVSASA